MSEIRIWDPDIHLLYANRMRPKIIVYRLTTFKILLLSFFLTTTWSLPLEKINYWLTYQEMLETKRANEKFSEYLYVLLENFQFKFLNNIANVQLLIFDITLIIINCSI